MMARCGKSDGLMTDEAPPFVRPATARGTVTSVGATDLQRSGAGSRWRRPLPNSLTRSLINPARGRKSERAQGGSPQCGVTSVVTLERITLTVDEGIHRVYDDRLDGSL